MDASHLSLRHRQEQGFGVIEVLLILIVVVVLAGAGWYVWMREHKSTSSSQTGSNTTHGGNPAPTPNPAPQSGDLTIKEWGVSIKPATSLPSVTYVVDMSDGHQWAKLTFPNLPASCAGFYHFNRAMAGQDLDGFGNTPQQLAAIDAASVKQVGNDYYYLGHGQGSCSADTSVTNEQNTLIQQLAGDASHPNSWAVEPVGTGSN